MKAGHLAIAGCVCDFSDLYGRGRILLVNLNGVTAGAERAAAPLLAQLGGELKNMAVLHRAAP